MKFTEEQYKKIVEAWGSSVGYEQKITNVVKLVSMMITRDDNTQYLEALALVNPASREWAHEQYVEKEKKCVWQSKQETNHGKVKRLYDAGMGISDSFMDINEPIHNGNLITETEIVKWGYKPDMFNKEEVE